MWDIRFFEEANGLVQAIETKEGNLYASLHTLKGNSGIFGIQSVASICHELEDELQSNGNIEQSSINRLLTAWKLLEDRTAFMIKGSIDRLQIATQQYEELCAAIDENSPHPSLRSIVEKWKYEPAKTAFERLEQQIYRIARALDKLPVNVTIEDNGVLLDPDSWQSFWSSAIHVVRNAIDHGLEGPDERRRQGKNQKQL